VEEVNLGDKFKKASKSVFTSTVVVYPDLLSPTSSPSSSLETPQKMEDEPNAH
jgi:hypothetical protein